MKTIFTQIAVLTSLSFFTLVGFSQNVNTVTDCNLNGWVKDLRNNATGKFINGPSTPPSGKGSFQLTTPDASFGRIRNGEYSGTPLSALTELSYSTFIEQRDSTVDCGFLIMLSDINGDGLAEHNLGFDPRYQTKPFIKNGMLDQGITREGVWQTWDALHGGWFFGNLGVEGDPDHNGPYFTLSEYLSLYPDAVIRNDVTKGGPALRLTSGGPVFSKNYIGALDNFKIGVNGLTTIHDFEFTTANAGIDKQVVYGYGSNCVTLDGSSAGGVAPYTYAWSPGGTTPNNSSTIVCPTVTTKYTLTVTDKNGCARTDEVNVVVNDVRCGNKLEKVKLCHKGEEICVSKESVEAHLKHGDVLGVCGSASTASQSRMSLQNKIPGNDPFYISNHPNPFTSLTKIVYEIPADGKVDLQLFDFVGKKIMTLLNADKRKGQHIIDFSGEKLSRGVYYYKLIFFTNGKYQSQTGKLMIMGR